MEFDQLAKAYSMLTLPKPLFVTSARGVDTKKPLEDLKKGTQVKVYFNLQAMYGNIFGGIDISANAKKDLISQMTGKVDGKGLSAKDKANIFLSGSVYSLLGKDNKIASYARSGILQNVTFEENQNTIKKIRESGSKTPCCFMIGKWQGELSSNQIYNTIKNFAQDRTTFEKNGYFQVIFNPMRNDHFMCLLPNEQGGYTPHQIIGADELRFLSNVKTPKEIDMRALPYLIFAKNPTTTRNLFTNPSEQLQLFPELFVDMKKQKSKREKGADGLTPTQRMVKLGLERVLTEQYKDVSCPIEKGLDTTPLKKDHLIIVSLYDRSGRMVEPWREKVVDGKVINKGNKIYTIDIGAKTYPDWKNCHHVTIDMLNIDPCEFLQSIGQKHIDVLFCFPPCTDWSMAGNGWIKKKFNENKNWLRLAMNLTDVARNWAIYSKFWMIENPMGRLRKAWRENDWIFSPHEFAGYPQSFEEQFFNYYTKKTAIWSNFPKPEIRYISYPEEQRFLPINIDKSSLRSVIIPLDEHRGTETRKSQKSNKNIIEQWEYAKLYLTQIGDPSLSNVQAMAGKSRSKKVKHYLRSLTPSGFALSVYEWLHTIKTPYAERRTQMTPIVDSFAQRMVIKNPKYR